MIDLTRGNRSERRARTWKPKEPIPVLFGAATIGFPSTKHYRRVRRAQKLARLARKRNA